MAAVKRRQPLLPPATLILCLLLWLLSGGLGFRSVVVPNAAAQVPAYDEVDLQLRLRRAVSSLVATEDEVRRLETALDLGRRSGLSSGPSLESQEDALRKACAAY